MSALWTRKNIGKQREEARIGQKQAAVMMKNASDKKFKEVSVGDSVALNVRKVDRGPLDSRNLLGRILNMRNNVYQIGTKNGVLTTWYSRNCFTVSGSPLLGDIPQTRLSLRQAVNMESRFDGQGFISCTCGASRKRCKTSKCSCCKANPSSRQFQLQSEIRIRGMRV